MSRADVSVSEKYRRIVEAYQIEIEYGRTIEAYQGKVGDKTVDFLRAGRVALLYQTLDGKETGYWDADAKKWVQDNDYEDAIEAGLKVAKKQAAPDFIVVPVHAPKEVKMMISRRMKSTLLAAVLAALARCTLAAATAAPGNLDELLEQTRSARQREAKANEEREKKFLAERNKQAATADRSALGAGRAARARRQRSPRRSTQREEADGAADAARREGRQPRRNVRRRPPGRERFLLRRPQLASSARSIPDREDFVAKLAQAKSLPSMPDLERFWFELQREMTESGRVARFKTKIVTPEGTPVEATVVRVGPFNALSGAQYLHVSAEPEAARDHAAPAGVASSRSAAKWLEEADRGYVSSVDRPDSRRAALDLRAAAERRWSASRRASPSATSSLSSALVGAALAIYQLFYLATVRGKVRNQLKFPDAPEADNPLGRVLAHLQGRSGARREGEDAEVVELRISEAVLQGSAEARALPVLPAARGRGRPAARPHRHRRRHDHHVPEHHRIRLERSEAHGQRHLAGDDRDAARSRHRGAAAVRQRLAAVDLEVDRADSRRAEHGPARRAPGGQGQCCLTRCSRRSTPLRQMRELGGPVVDWIFITCVIMWCIVIERYWYFRKILPGRSPLRCSEWKRAAGTRRAGRRGRSARR